MEDLIGKTGILYRKVRKYFGDQVKTGSSSSSRMICHLNKVTNKVRVEYISEYIYICIYIYISSC